MIDNFELICENYSPTEKINWRGIELEINRYKSLLVTKLYNEKKKSTNYFMTLFLLADEKKEEFNLLVRGNLSKWYFQKTLERSLTIEEYKDCINLLLSEIEVEEDQFMKAKLKKSKIRISVLLNSNVRIG